MTGTVVILVLLAAGLFAGAVWLVRVLRAELTGLRVESADQLAGRNADIDLRLVGMTETMDRRFRELDTKVDRRLGELDLRVDSRLAGMTETSARIHERLGKVDEATAQMNERAKDFQRFEQLLRPPKARGGVGELMLRQLLADVLPLDKFTLQHGFRGTQPSVVDRCHRRPVGPGLPDGQDGAGPRPRQLIRAEPLGQVVG